MMGLVERLTVLANAEGGGPTADALDEAADTITRLQAALKAVKAYYIDANPTKLTEAYVCDLVCTAISGRGVTP